MKNAGNTATANCMQKRIDFEGLGSHQSKKKGNSQEAVNPFYTIAKQLS